MVLIGQNTVLFYSINPGYVNTIPEDSPNTGFAGDVDAEASTPSGADRSMTEPEERGAGWRMNTGFAGNADVTASAASGAYRSMAVVQAWVGRFVTSISLP